MHALSSPLVLILVLMEDTLRVFTFNANIDDTGVLILVLMEDTLRVNYNILKVTIMKS